MNIDTYLSSTETTLTLQKEKLVSKEAIVNALTVFIKDLMKNDRSSLMRILYRIDVKEQMVNAALEEGNAAKNIALLIYERQYQKMIFKKNNPTPEVDDELAW